MTHSRSRRERRLRILSWRRVLSVVLSLAILGGLVEIAIHHYDPTRVVYKRLKAPDPYLYEKIDPQLQRTKAATLIRPDVVADPARTRSRLIEVIWGEDDYPTELRPDKVETGVRDDFLGDLPHGTTVTKLKFELGLGLRSYPYLARSANPTNRLVIYHHGFGDPIDRVSPFLRALLENGFDVLALNALGSGGTTAIITSDQDGILEHARRTSELSNVFHQMSHFDRPFRYHMNQIVGALGYAHDTHAYLSVDMTGFSMGAFLTVLSAIVIEEIERSYPVAGVYPNYMRRGQEIMPDGAPYYRPLLDTTNHLEMFVLGAAGPQRSQLQVFNRYDRCCFNGIRSELYKSAVQNALEASGNDGRFDVVIDETHADHRISRFAIETIVNDLRRER
jgi:hypothetical protein